MKNHNTVQTHGCASVRNLQYNNAEIVNLIHDEVKFIEEECGEILHRDFRGTRREYIMKNFISNYDGRKARKRIDVMVADNRGRWKLMNDLYDQQMNHFLQDMREALKA